MDILHFRIRAGFVVLKGTIIPTRRGLILRGCVLLKEVVISTRSFVYAHTCILKNLPSLEVLNIDNAKIESTNSGFVYFLCFAGLDWRDCLIPSLTILNTVESSLMFMFSHHIRLQSEL